MTNVHSEQVEVTFKKVEICSIISIFVCFQKLGHPKMDGENNGKPYEQMDDLGGKNPYFWFNTH